MSIRGNLPAGKIQRKFYLTTDVAEALRVAAFERRESQSEIVEQAVRHYLRLYTEEVQDGMTMPKWADVDATQYVVIADGQFVYPVLRSSLGPKDTPETLAALDEEEYQRWCERVPADERFGDLGTVEMIEFCEWLHEHGAERWDIDPLGEYPTGRRW